MRRFLLSLAIVLSMSAMSVMAQSVSYAKSLIEQERYLEAAKQLRPLADGGNAEAQCLAAELFFAGKGVSKSEAQGIKYAKMAANQGNKDGMLLLIEHYFRTNNFVKAYEACKEYTSKHPYLMTSQIGFGLGLCYLEGWGVAKDEERGMEIITQLDESASELVEKAQEHYPKQWNAYIDCHPELYKIEPGAFIKLMNFYSSEMPSFPGGKGEFMNYFNNEINYPREAFNKKIQGYVTVSFVVECDGSISDAKVTESVHPLLDEEVLRFVNNMPKWIPAMQEGKAVRTQHKIPVAFKIQMPYINNNNQ